MIFAYPLTLNSLVTGPKILVPIGSPFSSVKTTALLSNCTFDPSSLNISFLFYNNCFMYWPFFTLPLGIASLTLITIISPTPAYLLFEPPKL